MKIIGSEQNTEQWHQDRKGKILGSRVYSVLASKTGTKEEILAVFDELDIEYPLTKNGTPKVTVAQLNELMTPEAETLLMERAEKKLEFYQLIADRIAIDTHYEYNENDEIVYNGQNMMDRGHELEDKAAVIFAERTGKKLVQTGILVRDDNENIGQSPDRIVVPEGVELPENVGELPEGVKITEEVEIKCLKSSKHLQTYIERRLPDEYFSQAIQYFVVNDDLQKLYIVFHDPRIPYECGTFWIEINRTDPEVEKRIPQYLAYERIVLKEVDEWVERLTF